MHASECKEKVLGLASYMFANMMRVASKPSAPEGLLFGSFIIRCANKEKKIIVGAKEDKQMLLPTMPRTQVSSEAREIRSTRLTSPVSCQKLRGLGSIYVP